MDYIYDTFMVNFCFGPFRSSTDPGDCLLSLYHMKKSSINILINLHFHSFIRVWKKQG